MFWLVAFYLLGIERFLYGYIYNFPRSFKRLCQGPLRFLLDYDEGLYWEVAKHLGVVIKVFQFGVIGYDLFLRRSISVAGPLLLIPGLALVAVGQLLNTAVFNAIGAIGVYYGSQLGYDVPWCDGFPYNAGFSDPQYWGVVLCVGGVYLALSPSANVFSDHFTVAWLELFWYVASMKLLEHGKNGQALLNVFGLKASAAK